MKHEYTESALDALPEPESSLSKLRPLSEAGAVPEGCIRVYGYYHYNWSIGKELLTPDTHFADIQLPAEDSDEPETFEAHGKVWTRHTPGDAMPCDGSSAVMALLGDGTFCTQQAEDWNWNNRHSAFDIIGWRYADIRLPEASQAPATEAADPADPYAELKKAHAAGKVIQINCCTVGQPNWVDLPSPAFFGKPHEYRIKPETETFEPTPEPMSTKPISLTLAESMSLRDYFAGQSLAMLADPDFNHSPEDTARLVYRIADAMLAAREVKP